VLERDSGCEVHQCLQRSDVIVVRSFSGTLPHLVEGPCVSRGSNALRYPYRWTDSCLVRACRLSTLRTRQRAPRGLDAVVEIDGELIRL